MVIPKIIHYCWFGGKEMPKLGKRCLASWKKYLTDYEIMCWNEETFDLNSNRFAKEAYEKRKFASVADYVRLYALYNYGGIYMDTDVEVLKPIDNFLKHKVFAGLESKEFIGVGIIGSEKKNEIIKILQDYYKDRSFFKSDGSTDLTTIPKVVTDTFVKKGFKQNNEYQEIEGLAIYPTDVFYLIDVVTREKNITKNTSTIHWYSGSWIPFKDKVKMKVYKD